MQSTKKLYLVLQTVARCVPCMLRTVRMVYKCKFKKNCCFTCKARRAANEGIRNKFASLAINLHLLEARKRHKQLLPTLWLYLQSNPILTYVMLRTNKTRAKDARCTGRTRTKLSVVNAISWLYSFLLQEIRIQPTLSLFATLGLKMVALHVLLKRSCTLCIPSRDGMHRVLSLVAKQSQAICCYLLRDRGRALRAKQ